jgi:hypothetical protein
MINSKSVILSATLVLSTLIVGVSTSLSSEAATICKCTKVKKNAKKPCSKINRSRKVKTVYKSRRVFNQRGFSSSVSYSRNESVPATVPTPIVTHPVTPSTTTTPIPSLVEPPKQTYVQPLKPITPITSTVPITPNVVQTQNPRTKVGVHGSLNTLTGNVTPEVSVSRTLGNRTDITGYVGIGNTGYKVIPGKAAVVGVEGREAIEAQDAQYENWVSKVTPGKQFVDAVHYDRTIVYWQDSNGLLRNDVKDCVLSESELIEKLNWVKSRGGVWYGSRTLYSGEKQYVEETKTEYERVKVKDAVAAVARIQEVKAQQAVQERKEALSGINVGIELGYIIVNGVKVTAGAKLAGSEVLPTVGAVVSLEGEGSFVEAGVRKAFSNVGDAGMDVRVGGGLKF